jgi:prepilin-type N-terminal cleavage/methylation domain-containing protein
MWAKYKKHSGFTIVELLIVIIVIAILAGLTLVAYNGVQHKAAASKTTNSVTEYVKALGLYNADQGSYPATSSCFGTTSTYPGNGQCWTSASWVVSATFNTALQPYMPRPIEPDVTNIGTDASPKRGAFYDASTTPKQVYAMFAGISTCPSIGRLSYLSTTSSVGNNTGIYCIYQLY